MTSFFRKLSCLTRRHREDEILEELQFHLDEEAEGRQAEGMTQEAAQRAASRHLGNITLVKEETRAVWTWIFWEQLSQDLRYALRTMINNRAFTALAVLSLALGIGANTAIYSFMDSILLRSLPVADPESLVLLNRLRHRVQPETGGTPPRSVGSAVQESPLWLPASSVVALPLILNRVSLAASFLTPSSSSFVRAAPSSPACSATVRLAITQCESPRTGRSGQWRICLGRLLSRSRRGCGGRASAAERR